MTDNEMEGLFRKFHADALKLASATPTPPAEWRSREVLGWLPRRIAHAALKDPAGYAALTEAAATVVAAFYGTKCPPEPGLAEGLIVGVIAGFGQGAMQSMKS